MTHHTKTWMQGTACIVCGPPVSWDKVVLVSLVKVAYLRTACCVNAKLNSEDRIEVEFAAMCDRDYALYVERVKSTKLPAGDSLEAALSVLKQ